MNLHLQKMLHNNCALRVTGWYSPLIDAPVCHMMWPVAPTVWGSKTIEITIFSKLSVALYLERYSEHFWRAKVKRRFRLGLVVNPLDVKCVVKRCPNDDSIEVKRRLNGG